MRPLIAKVIVTLSLTLLIAPVNAQATTAGKAGEIGYPGSYSLVDMAHDQISKAFEADPDAKISITVSVPVINNNKVMINDLSGLPGLQKSADEEAITNAVIEIPFVVDDFKVRGNFDSLSFFDHMSNSLRHLTLPSKQSKNKESGSAAIQGGLQDAAGCGDYSVGTTFTITTSSCFSGTISNTYTCMPSATGGQDWFITSSYSIPPDTACISP